jgi:hypothetical protein
MSPTAQRLPRSEAQLPVSYPGSRFEVEKCNVLDLLHSYRIPCFCIVPVQPLEDLSFGWIGSNYSKRESVARLYLPVALILSNDSIPNMVQTKKVSRHPT